MASSLLEGSHRATEEIMTDYQNIPQNPLTNLRQQIREHWARYRPTVYAAMDAKGTLDEAIDNAAQLTEEAVLNYSSNPPDGMTPAQAFFAGWELFRGEWAFLPAEEDFDETDEEDPSYDARMALSRQLSAEMTVNEIWDEKNERIILPFIWDEEKEELVSTGFWDENEEIWYPAEGFEDLFPIESDDDDDDA
jgi:hypothetical protein